MKTACIAVLLVLAAHSAAAQNRTTELEARSYIQSAFITGAAPAILGNDVLLGPRLRERLRLPAGANRERIYEAIFTLTADQPLLVRKASAAEAAIAAHAAGRPAFVVEGGKAPLLVVYDLDRNSIAFVELLGALDRRGENRPGRPA